MDHEVFVPAAVETVRQLLRDPARIARCVHGLQQDAAGSTAEPEAGDGVISGRLKVRVANHSITYRGTLRITERGGDFVVEASGTEVRGTGSARTTLTIGLSEAEGGPPSISAAPSRPRAGWRSYRTMRRTNPHTASLTASPNGSRARHPAHRTSKPRRQPASRTGGPRGRAR